jgi:hypothetical protein
MRWPETRVVTRNVTRKNIERESELTCAKINIYRRCRGSNPGHPRDRREYLPLYYNDLVLG